MCVPDLIVVAGTLPDSISSSTSLRGLLLFSGSTYFGLNGISGTMPIVPENLTMYAAVGEAIVGNIRGFEEARTLLLVSPLTTLAVSGGVAPVERIRCV